VAESDVGIPDHVCSCMIAIQAQYAGRTLMARVLEGARGATAHWGGMLAPAATVETLLIGIWYQLTARARRHTQILNHEKHVFV